MIQRLVALLFLAVVGFAAWYVFRSPVPIDPVAWTPPNPPKATGLYRPNSALAAVQRIGEQVGVGPEAIAVDAQGRLYTGVEGGAIVRMSPDGSESEPFVTTGGRPLGLTFDAQGNLIVADADHGLLSVTPEGQLTVLATEHGGVPFRLTNDVDVAADGTIYFSDSSYKFPLSMFKADLMEHRPNGRLLAYDPAAETTRLVMDGLYFPNGVAVSSDQRSVLVTETAKYRIQRVWLTGDEAGSSEVIIDNLPGFPDNITTAPGGYWLALAAPRDADLDASLLPSPFMRKLLMRMPPDYLPEAGNYGYVIQLDRDGDVVRTLQDPAARYNHITSALQVGNTLYLGSMTETSLGRLALR